MPYCCGVYLPITNVSLTRKPLLLRKPSFFSQLLETVQSEGHPWRASCHYSEPEKSRSFRRDISRKYSDHIHNWPSKLVHFWEVKRALGYLNIIIRFVNSCVTFWKLHSTFHTLFKIWLCINTWESGRAGISHLTEEGGFRETKRLWRCLWVHLSTWVTFQENSFLREQTIAPASDRNGREREQTQSQGRQRAPAGHPWGTTGERTNSDRMDFPSAGFSWG